MIKILALVQIVLGLVLTLLLMTWTHYPHFISLSFFISKEIKYVLKRLLGLNNVYKILNSLITKKHSLKWKLNYHYVFVLQLCNVVNNVDRNIS